MQALGSLGNLRGLGLGTGGVLVAVAWTDESDIEQLLTWTDESGTEQPLGWSI